MPPAARITDMHVCPMVTGIVPHVGGPILPPGCPTVLIGSLPAARVTDMATCVGPPDTIIMGSPTVLIGNLMSARIGDPTAHGGVIVLGCFTVVIGEAGSGGGGGAPSGGKGGVVGFLKDLLGIGVENCRGKNLRAQEEQMSCAQATTSMIIHDLKGDHVDEETLRDESAARGSPPGYSKLNGTDDSDVLKMLNDHGVTNNGIKYNAAMSDIEAGLVGGKPVQLGLVNPGHWVIVDGVRTKPDGSKTLLIRDPGMSGKAGCREMDATEFQKRFASPAAQADRSCIITFPEQNN